MVWKKVLIAVPPGKIQEGLQVMLAALPHVRAIVTGDGETASQALRAYPFDLVILDRALLENEDLLDCLRGGQVRSLVLANRAQQVEPLLEAGINEVRLKGYPAHKLLALIKKILEDQDHE